MIKLFVRIVLLAALLLLLLFLFRPDIVANAGNTLLRSNNSNVSGLAQIIPDSIGNGENLQITLQGLISQAGYVVTLDQGSCGGKVLLTVGKVAADQNGSSTATMSLAALQSLAQQNVWVNVHQGSDASGPSVACGQVVINKTIVAQSGSPTPTPGVLFVPTSGVSTTDNGTMPGITIGGFPTTGSAPGQKDSYDNYTFPRKH